LKRIIVIGGGPAGTMAALMAAEAGAEAALWERNNNLGKKLTITGKGRCNITNLADIGDLVKNIPGNGAFLYGAFSRFSAEDTCNFFTSRGLSLKTERGRRVFPCSDDAHEVVDTLGRVLERAGVEVKYHMRAKRLCLRQGKACGVYAYSGELHPADAVIVATGGVTYPATGSTGGRAYDHSAAAFVGAIGNPGNLAGRSFRIIVEKRGNANLRSCQDFG